MRASDIPALVIGAIQGLAVSTIFLLGLFIGFCVLLGFLKLRATGRQTLVVRSLDELVGQERYARPLPPDTPRGYLDVLRSPELLEKSARKSA